MVNLHTKPTLLFYRNIENANEIRSKIMEATLHCAVLKPRYIVDPFQVLVATQLAVNNQQNQTMKTRSIHSEIIYNMSPNKKITDSLKTFGITDEDKEALFVILEEDKIETIKAIVKGTLSDLSEIVSLSNEAEVKKIYKIKDMELNVGTLLEAVINRIATKELVSF